VQASQSSNVVTSGALRIRTPHARTDDRVFFVQEAYNGFPELKFGNGVVGQGARHRQHHHRQILHQQGHGGNNIRGPFRFRRQHRGFVRASRRPMPTRHQVRAAATSKSLDNARFLAPLVYQAQNRCVTADDYKAIILANYGENIGAINVFGGENGDPNDPLERPIFGRVFIALKPKIGLRFTDIIRQHHAEHRAAAVDCRRHS
jgi:hypothetical protein